MKTIEYVHWQEDKSWLGYLEEFPDYWTQGDTLADLIEHLKDLYSDLSGGNIPGARTPHHPSSAGSLGRPFQWRKLTVR